jgi:hypothetical protein
LFEKHVPPILTQPDKIFLPEYKILGTIASFFLMPEKFISSTVVVDSESKFILGLFSSFSSNFYEMLFKED